MLRWIDESAGMHSRKLTRRVCVTRFIDKVDFISTARSGDIINVVTILEDTGNTSLTFRVEVKEEISNRKVASIGRVVFVAIDDKGQPVPHSVNVND